MISGTPTEEIYKLENPHHSFQYTNPISSHILRKIKNKSTTLHNAQPSHLHFVKDMRSLEKAQANTLNTMRTQSKRLFQQLQEEEALCDHHLKKSKIVIGQVHEGDLLSNKRKCMKSKDSTLDLSITIDDNFQLKPTASIHVEEDSIHHSRSIMGVFENDDIDCYLDLN